MDVGWAIFAVAFIAFGGAQTWINLRRMRTLPPPPDALASFRHDPPSAWQEHPAPAVAMNLHIGAILALATICFLDLALRDRGPTFFNVPAAAFLAFVVGVLGIVPLAQRAIRPATVHITPRGVVESSGTFAWERFGGRDLDPQRGIIRLYARRHPWFPLIDWRLPDRAEFARAVELIDDGMSYRNRRRSPPHGRREGAHSERGRYTLLPPAREAQPQPPVTAIPGSPSASESTATPDGPPGSGPAALVLAATALAVPPVLGGLALALTSSTFLIGYAAVAVGALVAAWNPLINRFAD